MSQVCPYCRTEVIPGQGSTIFCNGCGTPHHQECFDENGGCTLFGCKFAPPDEPKLAVSSGELLHASAPPYPMAPPPAPTGFGDVAAGAFPTRIMAPPAFGDVSAGSGPMLQPPQPRTPPPPPPGTMAAPPRMPGVVPTGYVTPGGIPALPVPGAGATPKTRIAFILLGILLGIFGAHNFYAGYYKRGVAQLLLTVLTLFYGAVVSWIWAIVEVCTVDRDSKGAAFA